MTPPPVDSQVPLPSSPTSPDGPQVRISALGWEVACPSCGKLSPITTLPRKGSLLCVGCVKRTPGLSTLIAQEDRRRAFQSRAGRHGIDAEVHHQILQVQGRGCAICGARRSHNLSGGRPAALAVDHDHTTGAVRGLLCTRCNTALERLETVPGWAAKAQAYLAAGRDYRETQ